MTVAIWMGRWGKGRNCLPKEQHLQSKSEENGGALSREPGVQRSSPWEGKVLLKTESSSEQRGLEGQAEFTQFGEEEMPFCAVLTLKKSTRN